MVRKYIRKTEGKSKYEKADLEKAIEDIKAGRSTIYRAHKQYNIPYVTLYSRVKGLRGKIKTSKGRPTYFTEEEEVKLANGLKVLEKWGFGMSRKEVLQTVGAYVAANKKETNFKDGVPGEDWFLAFKKRHNLSLKIPQNVEYARKNATDPFLIYGYFDLLEKTLVRHNLQDKPDRLWNLDETSLSIDPRKSKVVGQINKASSWTVSSPGRENTTILAMCNAAGDKAPPLIIFKGAFVWDQWIAPKGTEFPGTVYAASKKGWMESDIFKNYFLKTIIPIIGKERPVVIIYDGHATHINMEIIEAALLNNVLILKLPAHTSHLLQPLDLAVFKSFKNKWDQKVISWQRQNFGRKIPKKVFSQFLCETWQSISPEVIKNGFRKGGIYPLNKNAIPKEAFPPDALKRWESHQKRLEEPEHVSAGPSTSPPAGPSTSQPAGPSTSQPAATSTLQPMEANKTPAISLQTLNNLSFEEVLLAQIRQKPHPEKQKRTKLCPGSELLTSDEALLRLKEKNTNKTNIKIKPAKKQKKKEQSSSEEDSDKVPYMDSDDDEEFQSDEEGFDENDKNANNVQTLTIGKWVLVKYCTKKSLKHFVGQVKEKAGDDWVVNFLKFQNKKFIRPQFEDLDNVEEQDVVKILPVPQVTRRGIFEFDFVFDNYHLI